MLMYVCATCMYVMYYREGIYIIYKGTTPCGQGYPNNILYIIYIHDTCHVL